MNQKPLKQILAVMLAVSYLWIFAACVLLCEESSCADEHSKAALYANHQTPTHSICPITETPKVTTSDRFAFKTPDIKAVVPLYVFDFEPKAHYVDSGLAHEDFVFISPPLDLLPVIRI